LYTHLFVYEWPMWSDERSGRSLNGVHHLVADDYGDKLPSGFSGLDAEAAEKPGGPGL